MAGAKEPLQHMHMCPRQGKRAMCTGTLRNKCHKVEPAANDSPNEIINISNCNFKSAVYTTDTHTLLRLAT